MNIKIYIYKGETQQNTELSHKLLRDVIPERGKAELRYGPNGKPYFAEGPHFSISHTGRQDRLVWACAVSEEGPVGLDLQEMRQAEYLKLAERFFTPAEAGYIRAAAGKAAAGDEINLRTAFYRIWCRKEAYVKYTGRGFSETGFDSFSVLDERGEPAERLELCGEEVAFTECSVGDEYMCVVCRKGTENDKICVLIGE